MIVKQEERVDRDRKEIAVAAEVGSGGNEWLV